MGSVPSKNSTNEKKYNKLDIDEILEKTKECPICFEELDDYFILSCNHVFCYNCIQKVNLDFLNTNTKKGCPICNKEICKTDLKNIFSTWKLTVYDPIGWCQYNTVAMKKNLLVKKFVNLNLTYISDNHKLLIPYFDHDNFDKPCFFHSNKFLLLNSIYDGMLDSIFCVCLDGILDLSDKDCYAWTNFLKNNFIKNKNFSNKTTYQNIYNSYNYSKIKIRFCVKNINKVVIYNTQNGTMEHGLKLLNQNCRVLYRTYLYQTPSDTYIINELYAVWYF